MKVKFDSRLKVAGIGLVPWTRLGPERWLPDYKIASLYGWDLDGLPDAPEVFALAQGGVAPHLAKFNSQSLIETPEFKRLAAKRLAGYNLLTYKPVQPPKELLDIGCRFLSMNRVLNETLENKAEFRMRFEDIGLPFPRYKIVERSALLAGAGTVRELLSGRERVIVQDEKLSGGRGTFVVGDAESLQYALDSIELLGGGQRLVVSDLVDRACERSVQCCVTRYGTFVGPLQKQIIGHPLLANLEVPDGDRFCGAEISSDDQLKGAYPQIRRYALAIGRRLQEMGYRGIFGVDCLVDPRGKVFVLEINPRITGVTPLVTMLYRDGRDIPFYLLHVLETGGFDYAITDDFVDSEPPRGSLMVLHSQSSMPVSIARSPASGLYIMKARQYLGERFRLEENGNDHLLVQQYTPAGFTVRPGGRLMIAYTNGKVLDEHDGLLPEVSDAVEYLLNSTALKEIKK
jgi:hypothetical protein